MGNAAVEDGVAVDELEELGRLSASETAPEDDEDAEKPGVKPEGMPHE